MNLFNKNNEDEKETQGQEVETQNLESQEDEQKDEQKEEQQEEELSNTGELGKAKADADEKNKEVSLSTKNTKEVLKLIFAFVKVAKEAKENDGAIGANDLMLLTKMFPYIGPAFEDVDQLIPELKDLDEKEKKDLLVFTGANVAGLLDEDKAKLVEKALEVAIPLVELLGMIAKKK